MTVSAMNARINCAILKTTFVTNAAGTKMTINPKNFYATRAQWTKIAFKIGWKTWYYSKQKNRYDTIRHLVVSSEIRSWF